MGRRLNAVAQGIRIRGWGGVSIIVSIYDPGTFPPHLHQSSWRHPVQLADTKPGWHSTVPDLKTWSPLLLWTFWPFARDALMNKMKVNILSSDEKEKSLASMWIKPSSNHSAEQQDRRMQRVYKWTAVYSKHRCINASGWCVSVDLRMRMIARLRLMKQNLIYEQLLFNH